MLAAARGLADYVTKEQIMEEGKIYPEARELRSVAATVRPPSRPITLSSFPSNIFRVVLRGSGRCHLGRG